CNKKLQLHMNFPPLLTHLTVYEGK
ncbi:hypothetical protein TorRG33x02_194040, partial [Trema orientale]